MPMICVTCIDLAQQIENVKALLDSRFNDFHLPKSSRPCASITRYARHDHFIPRSGGQLFVIGTLPLRPNSCAGVWLRS
jgi:hypothetical protein